MHFSPSCQLKHKLKCVIILQISDNIGDLSFYKLEKHKEKGCMLKLSWIWPLILVSSKTDKISRKRMLLIMYFYAMQVHTALLAIVGLAQH